MLLRLQQDNLCKSSLAGMHFRAEQLSRPPQRSYESIVLSLASLSIKFSLSLCWAMQTAFALSNVC
jgi:hypothetical protein